MFTDTMFLTTPLEWIPVLSTCGHFQLVLTRWYDPADKVREYAILGCECTECNSMGRGTHPKYDTLAEAQAYAVANPHRPRERRA